MLDFFVRMVYTIKRREQLNPNKNITKEIKKWKHC